MTAFKRVAVLAFLAIISCHQGFAQEAKEIPQEAQKKTPPLRFLVGGALELGGDRVAEVYFTNGNTQSVNAGQGISIAVGAEYQVPKVEKLLLRGTVGYKYVTTAADNAHIRLTRVPVLLTANWMFTDKLRAGAGLAMHRGIQFNTDGLGEDVTFQGASGPTFEIAYRGVGLLYTAMTYTDQYRKTYSANAIGLTFSATLPRR
jgi:hypothetical protein